MNRVFNVFCSLALIPLSASLADDGQATTNTRLVQEAQTAMKEKGITLPPNSPVRVLPEDELVFVEFYNRDFSQILARVYFDREGHRFQLIDYGIDHGDAIPKIDGSVDLSKFSTADSLWKEVNDLAMKQNLSVKQNLVFKQNLPVFKQNPPDDIVGPQLFYAASQFLTRYPHDPRRWQVKILWFQWGPFIDSAMLKHSLAETIAADDAPDAVKADARQWLADLAKPKPKQQKPVVVPPRPKSTIYDNTIDGQEQIAAAVKTARAEHKRIFVQIGGNECGWCVRLHQFLSGNPAAAAALGSNYVTVLLAINEHNLPILQKYGMPEMKYGIPVIVILDADGDELTVKNTGELEERNSYSLEKITSFLLQWKRPL